MRSRSQLRRWWCRKGRPWWTAYRTSVLTVLALAAFAAGFVGFGETAPFRDRDPLERFFDQLYASHALLGFGIPNPAPNRLLAVGRFLVPFVAAWAGLAALQAMFADQWTRLRSRLMRRHIVVCGVGKTGSRVALNLTDRGYRVVAIEQDAVNPAVADLRAQGVAVLIGDAASASLLRQAGISRAARLIALCGTDGRNADIALRAAEVAAERRHRLSVVVRVVDPELVHLLRAAVLAHDAGGIVRLEFFNPFDVGPQALLAAHGHLDGPDPHLLVVGAGPLAMAVLLEAARRWPFEGSAAGRLPVTVIGPGATEAVSALGRRYSGVEKHCDVQVEDVDTLQSISVPAGVDPSTAIVCVEPDARAIASALTIRRQLSRANVVVCTTERSGLATLVAGAGASSGPELVGFAILDSACEPEVVLGGVTELVARGFHNLWLSGNEDMADEFRGQYQDASSNAALPDWDDLPEHLRESNRDQADGIHRKLELVGRRVIPDRDGTAGTVAFSDDEVEVMAQEEHRRWWAERTRSGWKLGPTKDVKRRISPYLVPWDGLDEDIRELDRMFVRALPDVLARAGFAIVDGDRTSVE